MEGQPTTACSIYVDDFIRTGNVQRTGRGRYPFGQYSDDSQLARELVLSIVARGTFEAVDYKLLTVTSESPTIRARLSLMILGGPRMTSPGLASLRCCHDLLIDPL